MTVVTRPLPPHGDYRRYIREGGCRCDLCRVAASARQRRLRQRGKPKRTCASCPRELHPDTRGDACYVCVQATIRAAHDERLGEAPLCVTCGVNRTRKRVCGQCNRQIAALQQARAEGR